MRIRLILLLAMAGCGTVEDAAAVPDPTVEAVTDEAPAHVHPQRGKRPRAGKPLVDHGGKVLATSHTYAIWWGPPADFPTDARSGLEGLLGGFGGSHYLSIANEYMRGATAQSSFAGSFTDTSAPPKRGPSTKTLVNEACQEITASGLAPDPDGFYAIFTSNLPHISYCAFHDHGSCNGVDIQIAYLPNTAGTTGCDPTPDLGCNGYSQGTRSVGDSLAHEFMEAVTDADINAWYDAGGNEIADKCEFVYGGCETLANGSSWQIQEEWSNAAGGCVQ